MDSRNPAILIRKNRQLAKKRQKERWKNISRQIHWLINLTFCHYSPIWGYFLTNLTPVKNNICFKSGFENDCGWFGLLLADTGPSGSIARFTPPPANHHVALLPESVPHLGSRGASAGALPPCWLRGWSSPRREMTIKPQQITRALNSVFGCKSSETAAAGPL